MMAAGHWKIVLFLFAVFMAMAAGVNANCNPPVNGDWTINGTDVVVCENRSIVLNGSLHVNDNANLSFNNVSLFINQTDDSNFFVFIDEDSSFVMNNSNIIDANGHTLGIYLRNKKNIIEDSFFHCHCDIDFYENSNNKIENSVFNKNSTSFYDGGSVSFYGNSTNLIINSTFFDILFDVVSNTTIQDSTMEKAYIRSHDVYFRGNDNLTIKDFSNGTDVSVYLELSDEFKINFSNVGITHTYFWAYGNSINRIINSTFYDVRLSDNSTNSIINSTISYFEFLLNSTTVVNSSTVENMVYGDYSYDYAYNNPAVTFDNSNIGSFLITSWSSSNLTTKDFTNGTNTYSSINSTTGLKMYMINTNITENGLEIFNNRYSTMDIINSSFNSVVELDRNSSATITGSVFYDAVYFPADTPTKVENSILKTAYIYGYSANEIINSTIVDSIFGGSNNTIKDSTLFNYITEEAEDGTNTTYKYGTATFKGNSINTIQNSSFKHADFEGNSFNTIMDSLIDGQLDFKENSINTLINLVSNSSAYLGFQDNSSTTIENSTIYSLDITSNGNKTVKIQDLTPGFMNNSVVSNTTSFKINLTNVNITDYIDFLASDTSINTIINSTISYGKFLDNATNIIENSTFDTAIFDENTVNQIKNSNFISLIDFRGSSLSIIENSTFNELHIYSQNNDSLNISGLSKKTINNVVLNSSTKINMINTNINDIFFSASGTSNNYLESSNFTAAVFAYNSTNTIKNTSFDIIYIGGYAIINFTDKPTINNISAYVEGISWQPRIYGFIDMPPVINFFDYNLPDSAITRYFPIYVYDQSNNTMSSKIIEIKYDDVVIWTGTTDDNGYVEPGVVFNSSNYNTTNFDIYATGSPTKYVGSINLLTDTPISLTYVYDPPSSNNNNAVNSGGGGGCVFKWECGDWSDCSTEGKQIRTCENKGTCSGSIGKPAESRDCTYIAPKTEEKINVSVIEEKKEEKLNASEAKGTGLETITGSVIAVKEENKLSGLLTMLSAVIILSGILVFLYNHFTYKRKMESRTKQNN